MKTQSHESHAPVLFKCFKCFKCQHLIPLIPLIPILTVRGNEWRKSDSVGRVLCANSSILRTNFLFFHTLESETIFVSTGQTTIIYCSLKCVKHIELEKLCENQSVCVCNFFHAQKFLLET